MGSESEAFLEATAKQINRDTNPQRMSIIEEITSERFRQIGQEGWMPEHDDKHHADGSLALVAALYASPIDLYDIRSDRFSMRAVDPWPWQTTHYGAGRGDDFVGLSYQVNDGDKRAKHDRRKRLVIAAAFIVAEIERLDRLPPSPTGAKDNG